MIKEKALNAVGCIDPDMIEEAENYKAKKDSSWVKWTSMAACLCLAVTGALILSRQNCTLTDGPLMTGDPIQTASEGDPVIQEYIGEYEEGPAHTVNADEEGTMLYPAEISGNTAFGAFEGPAPDDYEYNGEYSSDVKIMVGHFDSSLNKGDMAVKGGCVEFSESLLAAIDVWGESVSYRVVVEVFKDGTVIDSGSAEVFAEEVRLAEEGYTVAHETCEDSADTMDYFTLHAEASQLANFPAKEIYGYYISFYDEYLGIEPAEDPVEVFNGNFVQND